MQINSRQFAIIIACVKGQIMVMEHQARELYKMGQRGKAQAHWEFTKEAAQLIPILEGHDPAAARYARDTLVLPPHLKPPPPETH